MTKEEFAKMLDGRPYREEMTSNEEKLAESHGLLVCFGASDDLLELRGIIYDEFGAYNSGSVLLLKKKGGKIGAISEDDYNEVCEFMDDKDLEFSQKELKVTAKWNPKELSCSWLIETGLPAATFDIIEEYGELYCRGIVIEKADIEEELSQVKQ